MTADGAHRPRCEPAAAFRITEQASYASARGMDPSMGAVYDQDANNLRAQTLANYQEVPIRHLQLSIDKYLNGEKVQ